MEHTQKLTAEKSLAFMLAGHSFFTIKKVSTQGRFTYRITVPEDTKDHPSIYFVSVLTGQDNNNDYSYIGYIKPNNAGGYTFTYGKKSKISSQAVSVQVFSAIFNFIVVRNSIPNDIEIWHEGKCGRCGRKLTVPESIESGYGSECIKIIQNKFAY